MKTRRGLKPTRARNAAKRILETAHWNGAYSISSGSYDSGPGIWLTTKGEVEQGAGLGEFNDPDNVGYWISVATQNAAPVAEALLAALDEIEALKKDMTEMARANQELRRLRKRDGGESG